MASISVRALALRALAILLLLVTASAKADCGGTLDQAYCSDVRIALLYIDANNHAYITINGNTSALPCVDRLRF